jgi:hypothetical protein
MICKQLKIMTNQIHMEPFRLLHKDTKFRWGPEQEKSFNQLKQSLVVASNLSYFDLNAETQVITDASPVGLGVVLVQKSYICQY